MWVEALWLIGMLSCSGAEAPVKPGEATAMDMRQKLAVMGEFDRQGHDAAATAAKLNMTVEQVRAVHEWYRTHCCEPVVFYQKGTEPSQVVEGRSGQAPDVEAMALIVRDVPKVSFAGRVYPTEGSGLYRFFLVDDTMQNLIVVNGPDALMTLLQAFSNLHIHGDRHQSENASDDKDTKSRLLRQNTWVSVTCGGIASIGQVLLSDQGFQVRKVATLTLGELNGYDNGHWMLEVMDPTTRRWMLVDLDVGAVFRAGGRYLNAHEFRQAVSADARPEIVRLSQTQCDPYFMSHTNGPGFNYAFWVGWVLRDTQSVWQWYRRVVQAIGIYDPPTGVVYCGPAESIHRLYGEQKVVPETEWLARYYGHHGGAELRK